MHFQKYMDNTWTRNLIADFKSDISEHLFNSPNIAIKIIFTSMDFANVIFKILKARKRSLSKLKRTLLLTKRRLCFLPLPSY